MNKGNGICVYDKLGAEYRHFIKFDIYRLCESWAACMMVFRRNVYMNGIEKLKPRVCDLLTCMGVPNHTAGYSFLHTAILSAYEQPELLSSIIES